MKHNFCLQCLLISPQLVELSGEKSSSNSLQTCSLRFAFTRFKIYPVAGWSKLTWDARRVGLGISMTVSLRVRCLPLYYSTLPNVYASSKITKPEYFSRDILIATKLRNFHKRNKAPVLNNEKPYVIVWK